MTEHARATTCLSTSTVQTYGCTGPSGATMEHILVSLAQVGLAVDADRQWR
jgi:hypothetical protein